MNTVFLGAKRKLIVLHTLLFDVLLVHARTPSTGLQQTGLGLQNQPTSECPVEKPCYCVQIQTPENPVHKIACAWSEGGKKFPRFVENPGTIFSLSIIYNDLRYIPHDAFHDLKVMEIDLRGNRFGSRINGRAFLSVCKNLWSIKMDWCGITQLSPKVFRGMLLLVNLTLAENKLTTLPGDIFHDLCRLTRLSLAGNPLHRLPNDIFRYQTSLEHLDLGYCKLKHLPWGLFLGLWNLRYLDLRGNRIHNLEMQLFIELYSLQTLLLTHNPVRRLQSKVFIGLQNLRELKMEESHLEEIAVDVFYDTKSLQVLDLGDNRIRSLDFGTLFIPSLEELSLDGNRLSAIPKDIQYLSSLRSLDLSYNQLQVVDKCVLERLKSLRHLNLRENPIACNCSALWIRQLQRKLFTLWDRRGDIPFLAGKCAQPEVLHGVGITSWLDFDCLKHYYDYVPRCQWNWR